MIEYTDDTIHAFPAAPTAIRGVCTPFASRNTSVGVLVDEERESGSN
jgi:hypothetical protein